MVYLNWVLVYLVCYRETKQLGTLRLVWICIVLVIKFFNFDFFGVSEVYLNWVLVWVDYALFGYAVYWFSSS